MQYSPITLKFSGADSHLERPFGDAYFYASLNATRFTLLVGLIFYAAFGILDAILLPEVKETIWLIRYAIVCPLVAFWIALSFYKGYKKLWQFSIITVISLAGLGIIYMIAIAPQPANFSYYAGLILVFIFCYTFFKTRFLWASITCWGIVVIYEVVTYFVMHVPPHVFITNNFFFVGANIAGMFACYYIEYSARKSFYFQELLKSEKAKVSEINQELTAKIGELTEAYSQIKTLSGLLPICAKCKKIRDDKGYWKQIEEYISTHSEAEFSHSICPQCARELYGEFLAQK